jgi:acyl carrier protein
MPAHHAIDHAAILAEVTDIVRSVLRDPAIELTLETTADDLPAWDSMNHIAVAVEAECRFDIEFDTREIDALVSVGEIVRMIEAKLSMAHA